ncbi:Lrp/AsnC family transcriptional regulator [Paracoccaceae bacterium GXU_MW_L88]
MTPLDDRDLKILRILQTEGRITKTELAARIDLSPTPCWERLQKLQAAGIITGFGAEIAPSAFGPLMEIFMQAEIGSHRTEDFQRFEAAVAQVPQITGCWSIGGGMDYLLHFAVSDVNAYQRLVDKMLADGIGLQRYYTYIVTKQVKRAPFPPVPE